MSVDPPGFRPDRNYPVDVGHPYPDDSRPFGALGVIRSLRPKGQQMWDEDVNNAHIWLAYYVSLYAHYWRLPRAPYYTPISRNYILDPNQDPNYALGGFLGFEDAVYLEQPVESIPLQSWGGLKVPALADRILAGYDGTVWRGMASWHHYKDVIEIAFFMSQVRRNRMIASYVVEEQFYIKDSAPGCRARNYPYNAQRMEVHRNGLKVGEITVTQTESGADFTADTTFNVGDVLSLHSPDQDMINGILGVSVTLIGGLL